MSNDVFMLVRSGWIIDKGSFRPSTEKTYQVNGKVNRVKGENEKRRQWSFQKSYACNVRQGWYVVRGRGMVVCLRD